MTDKNPPPYQIREYQARPPVPGSHKGLMLALHAAARELGMQRLEAGVLPGTFNTSTRGRGD